MVRGAGFTRELGRGRGRRRVRGAAWTAATVLLLASAATACGDDSGDGSEKSPPKPPVDKTSSPPAPSKSATAPADPAAAKKQVSTNWEKFFDPAVPLKEKESYLENGEKMRGVLKSFSGDKRGRQVQTKVSKVEFTSGEAAKVTYVLTLKGATALPNAEGTAVSQGGTWKVSVNTLCALVKMSGNASPGPGC
ncbi:hypothetical protein ACQB60_18345 [Actinomycetota bacterium Odt1-20B]